jgi:hypothetical protein
MIKRLAIVGVCAMLANACGGGSEAPPAEKAAAPEPAPAQVPRVFFVSPQEGAMVKTSSSRHRAGLPAAWN